MDLSMKLQRRMKWTLPSSCMDPDVDDIWSIIPRLPPTERLMSAAVSSGPARLCLPAVCVVWSSPHPPPDLQKLLKNTDWSHGPGAMLTLKHFLQVVGEMNEKNDNPNVFFSFSKLWKFLTLGFFDTCLYLIFCNILHIPSAILPVMKASFFWGRDVLQ